MYSNMVRSFLGYEITQLLAVNCYCEGDQDAYWKFRLLLERYAFFEHMPFERHGEESTLLIKTINAYKQSAFGNSEFLKAHLRTIQSESSVTTAEETDSGNLTEESQQVD